MFFWYVVFNINIMSLLTGEIPHVLLPETTHTHAPCTQFAFFSLKILLYCFTRQSVTSEMPYYIIIPLHKTADCSNNITWSAHSCLYVLMCVLCSLPDSTDEQCFKFSDCASCTANTLGCQWCEDRKCISASSNCTVVSLHWESVKQDC